MNHCCVTTKNMLQPKESRTRLHFNTFRRIHNTQASRLRRNCGRRYSEERNTVIIPTRNEKCRARRGAASNYSDYWRYTTSVE
jgi:hypothetical protein